MGIFNQIKNKMMKQIKTIIAILVINISLLITAQNTETIVPLENYYEHQIAHVYDEEPLDYIYYKDTNNRMANFVGNWIFDDSNIYLKIVITKHEHIRKNILDSNNHNYTDNLRINILYKENDVELYNTINQPRNPISGSIILSNNKIEMYFIEPSLTSCYRKNNVILELEFIANGMSNTDDTLKWSRIRVSHGSSIPCPDGSEPDGSDFLIPATITFHRE